MPFALVVGPPVIDEAIWLAALEGSRELAGLMAGIFRQEAPDRLRKIAAAAAAGDLETLRREAHALHGSAAQLAAEPAAQAARAVESAAKSGDSETAISRVPALHAAIERVVAELDRFEVSR